MLRADDSHASMIVRIAYAADAAAVADIYAHHVLHGTATFDTIPPDAGTWQTKIADIEARGWPFLVAEGGDGILGYAYAAQFRDRAAYAETCENSIYVRVGALGHGVGTALLAALVERARASGFRQMIAVIGGGEPASIALHSRLGFVHAGRLRDVGCKFGRLLDTVYMQLGMDAAGGVHSDQAAK